MKRLRCHRGKYAPCQQRVRRFLKEWGRTVRRSGPFGKPFFNCPCTDLPASLNTELEHDVSHVGFDGSFADNEHLGDLAVAFSLGNQACHFTLASRQPSKGLFGGTAWCQRALLGQHSSCLREEMRAKMFVRYVGGQFFDERSSRGEYLFGLFPACLYLIELAQGNTNPPVPWSQPLYMRCFLCGSQHRFGLWSPMKRGQGFAAQFPEARDDALFR